VPSTTPLSRSTEEFKLVERQFLDGWPGELKSQVRVDTIHKINNPTLESQYQQFVRSNAKYATQECIGWHGTSAECRNGSCMSSTCSLCQIVRHGFKKDCARKNTTSYGCWGAATYFANKSFVCHTYNGASQPDNETLKRCTIMTKINRGHSLHHEKFEHVDGSFILIPFPMKKFKYDTVQFNRNYYIAPVDYILVYNNLAAIPAYIVVYSYRTRALQIRSQRGNYCSFHNEYHGCNTACDGHCYQLCLGTDDKTVPPTYLCNSFETLTDSPSYSQEQILPILEILGDTIFP
jgi:hypothetical protein